MLDLPPSQDASQHQDDITVQVSREPYKPSFVTVTLWGVDRPKIYVYYWMCSLGGLFFPTITNHILIKCLDRFQASTQ